MRNHLLILALFALPGGADAAPFDPRVARSSDPDTIAARAWAVFKQHCHSCHDGPESDGGFDIFDVDVMRSGNHFVGKEPDASPIYVRMQKGTMPPRYQEDRPTAQDIEVVRQWIVADAPKPKTERLDLPVSKGDDTDVDQEPGVVEQTVPTAVPQRGYVSNEQTLLAVRDHLRESEVVDRPYLRYFTLTNLSNNPNVKNEQLATTRAAFSAALNHLSWMPKIVVPKPVDAYQTIYWIDIRDFGWEKDYTWRTIVRHYPYGLKYQGTEDTYGEILTLMTGQADPSVRQELDMNVGFMPIIRADWFVAHATRPPLYHTLLSIPTDVTELRRRLGVDMHHNFRHDRLYRAGFIQSGISTQNRMIERHWAQTGAYWESYDFKPNARRGNLIRFPLGPDFADNSYKDQSFEHDGGEIIFHLPNGLQGYMLVDGKGQRIDEGPTEVVRDKSEFSGSIAIVNGISCIACHSNGMKDAPPDRVRVSRQVGGPAQQKVERLYPPEEKMKELMDWDKTRFLNAMHEATRSFLPPVGEGKIRTSWPDSPIAEVARLYHNALDADAIAGEFGFEGADAMFRRTGEDSLRRLGLGVVIDGGKLSRAEWEKRGRTTSQMQDVARIAFRDTPLFQPLDGDE